MAKLTKAGMAYGLRVRGKLLNTRPMKVNDRWNELIQNREKDSRNLAIPTQ